MSPEREKALIEIRAANKSAAEARRDADDTPDEGGLVLVGQEMTGTFDDHDIAIMAQRGLIVLASGWGQSVYRHAAELEGHEDASEL